MPTARDTPLHAPVQFPAGSRLVRGHLARKSRSFALVVAEDGGEYNVPWPVMQHHRSGVHKNVSPRNEELVADFLPGAEVSFRSRSDTLRGVVVRNGPKRARVACEGTEYSVPYGLLKAINSDARESNQRRLSDCVAVAEALIQQHGLDGWSFQFDSAQKRAGACTFNTKVISLSRFYCIKASDAQIRDTILHEIAHALAGPKHNHDATWKRIARAIGCTADRCHTVDFAPPKYIASCPRCGWHQKKNRRLRGGACRTCGQLVTYRRFTQQVWDTLSRQRA
ncbi:MAG: SprT-like domain-containing protein [Bryobacterales bacterium]|nr:SprT-like domain-containing protein [Bryobacterales bacterium]